MEYEKNIERTHARELSSLTLFFAVFVCVCLYASVV